MKKITLLLLILLGVISSCQVTPTTDDPEKLKTVLVDYFNGVSAKDFQKMKDLTTDDFLLYEDGKVFNNDSIFKVMNSLAKFTIKYRFENFKINVDNTSGNMSYFSHAEFTINDTTQTKVSWLESATFKKIDGNWKMNFLHSSIKK